MSRTARGLRRGRAQTAVRYAPIRARPDLHACRSRPAPTIPPRAARRRRHARGDPARRRARGVLRLHGRRRRRRADGARRRARRRARACSRCPASRSAARCWCTTIRPGCSSRRAPTTTSRRGCTTTASASASSTTTATELYVVVEVPRARERHAARSDGDRRATSGPTGAIARAASALRGPAEPARDGARRSRGCTTTAASGCSRRAPASASRSATSFPALRWAAANGERTVVSTNTINLQEQLVGKDLPFLAQRARRPEGALRAAQGVAQLPLPAAARAGDVGGAAQLFEDGMASEVGAIARVGGAHDRRLARATCRRRRAPRCGTRSSAEPDLCTRMKCPHFDECFLFKARREAAQADVIVVNHHLLLSDVAVRRVAQNWDDAAVLPAYARLVVDEGHHLEDAAAAHLGSTVTRRALAAAVQPARPHAARDCCPRSSMRLVASEGPAQHREPRPRAGAARAGGARGARQERRCSSTCSTTFLAGERRSRWCGSPTTSRRTRSGARGLDARARRHCSARSSCSHEGLRLVRERIESEREARRGAGAAAERDARGDAAAAGGGRRRCGARSRRRRTTPTRALDRGARQASATSPCRRCRSTSRRSCARICSSASTRRSSRARRSPPNGGFDFLARRLGLDEPELEPTTAIYPSPFDYARRRCSRSRPTCRRRTWTRRRTSQRVVRVVLDVADGVGRRHVRAVHEPPRRARSWRRELRARGVERRWPLLVHGDETRDALLARFRDRARGAARHRVVLGRRGRARRRAARRCVIAKLPFRVPTEPVTAAQCEAIEARGGDRSRVHAAARVAAAEAGIRPPRSARRPTAASS